MMPQAPLSTPGIPHIHATSLPAVPRVDKYGTQQPISLLKLFIDRKGLYDRGKDLSWKNMKDVQVEDQYFSGLVPDKGWSQTNKETANLK